MSEMHKAIYSQAWQELMNTRNLAIVDELFAPNYVRHDPHFPLRGREALKWFVTVLHNGFSDIRFTLDDLIVEGNKVVKRFTLTCTHTGAFRGIPPSGKRLTLTGLTLGRIAHGHILEEWESTDWLGWQQQLGIIPEPATDELMALALPWPHLKRRDIMTDLRITTTRGTSTDLDETTVQGFKTSLRGPLLCPGDEGYDEARKVWNAMIDKRPALIVRCAGVADVIHAVNFARTNNLLVSVRGGGHNVAGTAVCDGGLMIDLSRMRSVRVDPIRRTARAEGGAKWIDFDHETQAFGLATTGGTASDTGIAGLTLGGGIGWLGGKYGLVSDNLLSVDIVTADGRFLTASATENADLFWGVRGGGGNFGVVTSFEYQLHPVGPMVLGGMVLYPFEKAKDVLKFYRDFSSDIPDELTTASGFLTSPEGHPVVAIAACYNGSLEAGEEVLRPLREFGPPLADHIQPVPYTQVQKMFDEAWGIGRQYYEKAPWVKEISGDVIDILATHFAQVTSPLSAAVFFQKNGAMSRGPHDKTAFGHRDAQYLLVIISIWLDPGASESHIRWARGLSEAIEPFTSGGEYVNGLGQEAEEGTVRIKAGYGANYEQLVALKNKYDPTNLFRHNQNIKPTV